MKNYIVTVNGVKYEVSVEETNSSSSLDTQQTIEKKQEEKPVETTSKSKTSVNAPMPGVILKINVTKGQTVKKGDVLLVLEAMKMENEIACPEDGVVDIIAVNKGTNVKTGDLLIGLN